MALRRRLLLQLQRRRGLHCSRPVADVPGHRHPAFKLAKSDFVLGHNAEQHHRTDAPKALRAARALCAGEALHTFLAAGSAAPSHWTLQIGPSDHIDLAHHIIRHINHACDPNVRLQPPAAPPAAQPPAAQPASLSALRDIPKDEELTLDYNSSEHELLGGTFTCVCGVVGCVGEVRGWAHLSVSQQEARRARCMPWLLEAAAGDARSAGECANELRRGPMSS